MSKQAINIFKREITLKKFAATRYGEKKISTGKAKAKQSKARDFFAVSRTLPSISKTVGKIRKESTNST